MTSTTTDQARTGHAPADPDDGAQAPSPMYVDIKAKAGTNHGNVVGLQVGTITGDVYATQRETHVQIIALAEASRGLISADRLEREKCPYPGSKSFTFGWRSLFFGRAGKSAEVLRLTTTHPLVVLHGRPRTGKTSLLSAAVMPQVADFGAIVARVDQYHDLVPALHEAIAHVPGKLPKATRSSRSLSEFTRSVTRAGKGTFVLVLDQFERLFDLPEDDQLQIVNELRLALEDDPQQLLRIVLSIRIDDYSEHRLAALQEAIPGLLNYRVELDELSRDEARAALEQPLLTIDGSVQFASPEVRERVLDDLIRLSGSRGTVDPSALQMVGECLFARARERFHQDNIAPVISAGVYGNGSAAIIDACLRDIYDTRFSNVRKQADAVLHALIAHQDDTWIARTNLDPNVADDAQLDRVLQRFVDAGLLIRRRVQYDEYAFLNSTIAATMSRLSGPDALHARRARQILTGAWAEWDVLRVPAGKTQLRFLSGVDGDLQLKWQQSLLLLRSAVHHREDPRRWLAALLPDAERLTILSQPATAAQSSSAELQLVDRDGSTPPEPEQEPLAWITVRDDDRVDRETAALVLAAVESMNPVNIEARLRPAFLSVPDTARKRWRRAGLWGVLTDAGVPLHPIRDSFGPLDRLLIWAGRAGRRISRNQRAIWMNAGGVALGMGLGLGILRALIAGTTTFTWQLELSAQFMWAALAGLLMGLAMQITEAVIERSADWRVVAAGALGFGAGHLWVMSGNGLPPTERLLIAGLGFAWGAILAAALAYHGRVRRAFWLGWIAAAAVWFGLLQALLNQVDGNLSAMPLVQNGTFYGSEWQQETPRLLRLLGDWTDRLATFDAALVGCVLMLGLLVGTWLANRWFAAWRELEAKSGI